MTLRNLLLAILLAATPASAFSATSHVHFIQHVGGFTDVLHGFTNVLPGAKIPAILMETLPNQRPGGHVLSYPILLQTLKPLDGCRIMGYAHWLDDPRRWVASIHDIDCGHGTVQMHGYVIGHSGMVGMTPKTGTRVYVVFTSLVHITDN